MLKSVASLAALACLGGACVRGPVISPEATPVRVSATKEAAVTPAAPTAPFASIPFEHSALITQLDSETKARMLEPVDPATGRVLAGRAPVDLGVDPSYVFSNDGDTLIFTKYAAGNSSNGELHFLDLPTWKDDFALVLLGAQWTSALALSPDGSELAVATAESHGGDLWIVDAHGYASLAHRRVTSQITALKFTSDGQSLMTYEHPGATGAGPTEGSPQVDLRSASDLSVRWSKSVSQVVDGFVPVAGGSGEPSQPGAGSVYQPALVFSPISDTLYIVHADVPKLTRVDFDRRLVITLAVRPAVSWLERLLALEATEAYAKGQNGIQIRARIAPDGNVIYADGIKTVLTKGSDGNWLETQSPLPLQAIRLKDASQLFESTTRGMSLQLSADGARVLVPQVDEKTGMVSGTAEVDATDGSLIELHEGTAMGYDQLTDGTPIVVSAVRASPDAAQTEMTTLSLNFTVIGSWITSDYADWLTPAP